MAKKKSKASAVAAAAAAAAAATTASTAAQLTTPSDAAVVSELFLLLQAKGTAWYDKEREGIALIEAFQTALTACRDDQRLALDSADGALTDDSGLGGNLQMDPLLAEELFAQVRGLAAAFEALLTDMYAVQERARKRVASATLDEQQGDTMVLRGVDYLQFMTQELAAFEAEFQHVEAMLALVSFDMTPSELRTLVISWSTSPFLEPEQSREFRSRHDLSERALRSPTRTE